jgi:hypothetical protein
MEEINATRIKRNGKRKFGDIETCQKYYIIILFYG